MVKYEDRHPDSMIFIYDINNNILNSGTRFYDYIQRLFWNVRALSTDLKIGWNWIKKNEETALQISHAIMNIWFFCPLYVWKGSGCSRQISKLQLLMEKRAHQMGAFNSFCGVY